MCPVKAAVATRKNKTEVTYHFPDAFSKSYPFSTILFQSSFRSTVISVNQGSSILFKYLSSKNKYKENWLTLFYIWKLVSQLRNTSRNVSSDLFLNGSILICKLGKKNPEVQILLSITSLKIQENSLRILGNVPKLQECKEEQNVVGGGEAQRTISPCKHVYFFPEKQMVLVKSLSWLLSSQCCLVILWVIFYCKCFSLCTYKQNPNLCMPTEQEW